MKLFAAILSTIILSPTVPAVAQSRTTIWQRSGSTGATRTTTSAARPQHGRRKSPTIFRDSVVSGGNRRTFLVHVPGGYDRNKPTPVIMIFHGLGGDGSMMSYLTQFDYTADKHNFIVVYPDGVGRRWDDGKNVAHGDAQFISDMLARLASAVNVDRKRIYAAGYSNGGHFTMYLACVTNWLSAIAVIGSSMMTATESQCSSSQRTPAIFFIGTSDPLVPSTDEDHNATLGKLGDAVGLSGLGSLSAPMAKMGGLMSAEETVEFWARHNQNSPSPYTQQMPDVDTHDGTKVTKYTYGAYSGEVDYYKIQGGGHTRPGAIYNGPSDLVGAVSHDIDATDLIMEFF